MDRGRGNQALRQRACETGREALIDTSDKQVRDAYAKEAVQRAKTRTSIFQRTRVDSIHVRTDRSYVNEIYRFFRMRERRYA